MSPLKPSCLTKRQGSLELEKLSGWDGFIDDSVHWRSRFRFLPVSVLVDCFLLSSIKGNRADQQDCPHSSSSSSDCGYHRNWLRRKFDNIPWQRIAEEAYLSCAHEVEHLVTEDLIALPRSLVELGEIAHREAREEWAGACFRALGSSQNRDPRIYLERLFRIEGIETGESETVSISPESPPLPLRPGGSLGFDEWALERVLCEIRELGADTFPYIAEQFGEDSEKTEPYEMGVFKEIGVGKLPASPSHLLSIERLYAKECPEYFRFRVATNSLERIYSSRRKPRSRQPHFLLKVELDEKRNWFLVRDGIPGGLISIIRASLCIVAIRLGLLSQQRGWNLDVFYRRNHSGVGVDADRSDSHTRIHGSTAGRNIDQMLFRITRCLLRVHPQQQALVTPSGVATIFLRVGDVAPGYSDEQDGLEIPITVDDEGVRVGMGSHSSDPVEIASAVVNLIFRDFGLLQEAVR